MTPHHRNVIKLGGALVVAFALALSAPLLMAQSGKVEVHWLGQSTFKITKPKFVIPMHYGTTPVLKGTPQGYMAALGQTTTKVKLEF